MWGSSWPWSSRWALLVNSSSGSPLRHGPPPSSRRPFQPQLGAKLCWTLSPQPHSQQHLQAFTSVCSLVLPGFLCWKHPSTHGFPGADLCAAAFSGVFGQEFSLFSYPLCPPVHPGSPFHPPLSVRHAQLHQVPRRSDGNFRRSGIICMPGSGRPQTSHHLDEEGEESQFSTL